MAATTELARDLGFLVSEAPGSLSREQVTIVAGTGSNQVVAGTVLGKVTASGKYALYDDDNVDGTEVAVGVLTHTVDSTDDVTATIIVRLAEVTSTALIWASTNDAGDKTAGLADLAAKYVIAR